MSNLLAAKSICGGFGCIVCPTKFHHAVLLVQHSKPIIADKTDFTIGLKNINPVYFTTYM